MKRALRPFGYLNFNPKEKLYFDPTYLDHNNTKFENHKWKNRYPDVSETIDDKALSPKLKGIKLLSSNMQVMDPT